MKSKNHLRNQFSEKLAAARRAKGFESAQEFAKFAGIEPHRYRSYEAARSFPRVEIIIHICHTLGVTPNDLIWFVTAKTTTS